MRDAQYWIDKLDLQSHPEGGYFRETFVSEDVIQTGHLAREYSGPRKAYTLIYYLLKSGEVSKLHRLKSDEIWNFYTGSTLTIHVLETNGDYVEKKLGPDFEVGESFQHVVKPGCWFGASVDAKNSFALVGCFVSPGFDFEDFEMAEKSDLIAEFPDVKNLNTKGLL
jgi:uncharacterized protein